MRQPAEASDEINKLFERMDALMETVPLHRNRFYESFRKQTLTRDQLQFFADQYYYYIRTFPRFLATLSSRVESEEVRLRLARTVVSELGECHPGKMHFQLFEKAIAPTGVRLRNIDEVEHIPEAEALVQGLRRIFCEGPTIAAIGGHYTIERCGLGMIDNLYEGMRRYADITVEDMEYFYLHLFLEADHVDWIKDAVRAEARPAAMAELEAGALEVAKLLANFWQGLYTHLFASGRAAGEPAAAAATASPAPVSAPQPPVHA